jgi:membrane peptidoglycan carboxypeptidase
MRKMMEGVVLFGTGKSAQLDGYSSGGKTGTAQKIDPVTHTYSKTMHIASFAGFAPVNDPAISVAIVIDSPKGAYYGADVSAPVFAEVAQQVLEYLGVQHDIDVRPVDLASKKDAPVKEDDAPMHKAKVLRLSTRPPTTCPATIRCALRPLRLPKCTCAPRIDAGREFTRTRENGRSTAALPHRIRRIISTSHRIQLRCRPRTRS